MEPIEKGQPLPPRQPDQSLIVLILAAGLGTRKKSARAKVLHELDGLPLITHVCRTARSLGPEKIYVVVGHHAGEVERAVQREATDGIVFVKQTEQRGTGDAVLSSQSQLENKDFLVLILSGDVPLILQATLEAFVSRHRASSAACSILSVRLENPTGYGRVIRDVDDRFLRIVEQKDATPEEQALKEINAGIYCFDARKLFAAPKRVEPSNQQCEYYLTDVPQILLSSGAKVNVQLHGNAREMSGINT